MENPMELLISSKRNKKMSTNSNYQTYNYDIENQYVNQTDNNSKVDQQYTNYTSTQDTNIYPVIEQSQVEVDKAPLYPVVDQSVDQNVSQETKSSNCKTGSFIFCKLKKIGLLIAMVIFFTCLFLNLLITPWSYPWSFYPCLTIGFLCLTVKTLSCREEETKLKVHKLLFGYINSMLIVTNLLVGGYPWSIYILGVTSFFLALHYSFFKKKSLILSNFTQYFSLALNLCGYLHVHSYL